MGSQSMHTTAFVLSLVGGLIIVLGSLLAALLSAFGSPYGTHYGMGSGMMGRFGFGFGYGSGWFVGFSIAALVFGILVVLGAIMLNARPAEHMTWA
jgi:hypothetical protein